MVESPKTSLGVFLVDLCRLSGSCHLQEQAGFQPTYFTCNSSSAKQGLPMNSRKDFRGPHGPRLYETVGLR